MQVAILWPYLRAPGPKGGETVEWQSCHGGRMAVLPWRSNGGPVMAVERRSRHGGRMAVLPWRSNGGLAMVVLPWQLYPDFVYILQNVLVKLWVTFYLRKRRIQKMLKSFTRIQ